MTLSQVAVILLLSLSALAVSALVKRRSPREVRRAPRTTPRPAPRQAPRATPRPAPGPTRLSAGTGRHRVTVDAYGLAVEMDGSGASSGWRPLHTLSWPQIVSLHMGTGTLDDPIALYARKYGEQYRAHLVDGRALTRAEWTAVAGAVEAHTAGRIRLDLTGLDRNPPFDRF